MGLCGEPLCVLRRGFSSREGRLRSEGHSPCLCLISWTWRHGCDLSPRSMISPRYQWWACVVSLCALFSLMRLDASGLLISPCRLWQHLGRSSSACQRWCHMRISPTKPWAGIIQSYNAAGSLDSEMLHIHLAKIQSKAFLVSLSSSFVRTRWYFYF